MDEKEMEDWLVGVVAVKMGIPPKDVRDWEMRDLMLVYNTLSFLNEMEKREMEKAKKEAKIRRMR